MNMEAVLDKEAGKYRLGDKLYPRVTTILKEEGFIPDFSKFKGSQEAMERGTHIHEMIALFESKEGLDESRLTDYMRKVLDQYKSFKHTNAYVPEFVERTIVSNSPMLGYGGTVDSVGTIGGVRVLIDFKSGSPMPHHFLQLCAYNGLLLSAKIYVTRSHCLYLTDKTWRLSRETNNADDVYWQSILMVRRARLLYK